MVHRTQSDLEPRQLILDLSHRPAMGREDFLISSANETAVDAIDSWPNWPHHGLALIGPAASGKTHLASVWRTNSNAIFRTSSSLSIDTVPDFLATGAVVIEDFANVGFDEAALFHLLNLAREGKASVLLTSQTPPAHWPVKLPDLASRLRALPIATLEAPDDDLLRAVLIKLFADRQLIVDVSVVTYLVARMERSVQMATRLVAMLDDVAMSRKSKVGRGLAKEILEKVAERLD